MNSHIASRHPLGTLLSSVAGKCGVVIGTWRWASNLAPGGAYTSRDFNIGSDPRSDDSAVGYLILPIGERSGYFYFLFGGVAERLA
jgi:hypothetical protein